jgi:hypothetical protein
MTVPRMFLLLVAALSCVTTVMSTNGFVSDHVDIALNQRFLEDSGSQTNDTDTHCDTYENDDDKKTKWSVIQIYNIL